VETGTTHVVFAPHHRLRGRAQTGTGMGASRASAMGWAQRLKHVFSIDVDRCNRRGAAASEPLPRARPSTRQSGPRARAQKCAPYSHLGGGRALGCHGCLGRPLYVRAGGGTVSVYNFPFVQVDFSRTEAFDFNTRV